MPYRHLKPGESLMFGRYPQTACGLDRTPIKWRVLQSSGKELFILSEYILDCKRYHGEFTAVTWQNCAMRKWLHDEFYDTAFTPSEKERIMTVLCKDNGEQSPDTEDKVFLLSVVEVKEFTDTQAAATRRRTVGTEFAKVRKADGCRLYVYDKGVEKDYIVDNNVRKGCSWWWTRTQLQSRGGSSLRAAFIGPRSNIKSYGRVDIPFYGVRPALKIYYGNPSL